MYEVIENLKSKIILNEKIILDLKNYIYNKYPNHSSGELSLILADGIHRIINNNMAVFQGVQKNEIESILIRNAVTANDFSISAYKLFCQYCNLDLDNESSISILHNWLSIHQGKHVDRNELTDFINIVKVNEKLNLEDAIKNAAEVINEKRLNNNIKQSQNSTPQVNRKATENYIGISTNRVHKVIYMLSQFTAELVNRTVNIFKTYNKRASLITASLLIIAVIILNAGKIGNAFMSNLAEFRSESTPKAMTEDVTEVKSQEEVDNGLPEELQYIEIDRELLRNWLETKDSMLAEEPYLSSIIDAAKQYNINPLLLIAITGQEQGFVPKHQENALRIANNPFNVYGSWANYNTTINDSSRIAAQTIISLSEGRPEGAHAIQWINQKYAEDKNWWVGVDKIFSRLNREIVSLDI